jgi:hypothetical protein
MHVRNHVSLDHIDRMTDSTGLIQHAIHGIPRRDSGYTTDDNARALRLCTRLWQRNADDRMLGRVVTYLSFLEHARIPGRGFHNFMGYQRQWLDAEGCGDCQGQAVRALVEVFASRLPDDIRSLAWELIEAVLPALADLRSLRAQAYVILAWDHLWSAGVSEVVRLESTAWSAALRLVESYHRAVRPDWQWFEPRMTYANAVLPHALFVAGRRWPNEMFLDVARSSFAFLDQETTKDGVFWPIGNHDWYGHGKARALYDQQPLEAALTAEAALAAFEILDDPRQLYTFHHAIGWFHCENSLKHSLVDVQRGACCDGLQASGANRNQGAESTLAFLWAQFQNAEVRGTQNDVLKIGGAS